MYSYKRRHAVWKILCRYIDSDLYSPKGRNLFISRSVTARPSLVSVPMVLPVSGIRSSRVVAIPIWRRALPPRVRYRRFVLSVNGLVNVHPNGVEDATPA